jgi:ABC-2 type transport system ATP-binding protein
VGAPDTLFDEPLVLEMQVNPVSKELLQRLGTVALAVRQHDDDPSKLLVEVRDEEGAADVASIVQECGARLYALSPHHRSLEQLFLQTIDASRHK